LTIEWRPVLVAFVISVIAGAAFGFAWGIVGFTAFMTAADSADAFYESTLAAMAGFAVGLIPVVIGAAYLTRAVIQQPYKHVAIFGGLNVLMAILFIPFFPDDPTTMSDGVYFIVLVPVALVTCWATQKLTTAD
jgi:hypothetical protein